MDGSTEVPDLVLNPGSVDMSAFSDKLAGGWKIDDYANLSKGRPTPWMPPKATGDEFSRAYALTLHRRLHCTPDEIALALMNYEHGNYARRNEEDYVTDIVRKVIAPPFALTPGASSQGFAAPFLDTIWDDNLAIDWLISGVLENKVIAEIWGPSGVYKSFLALDMAVAIANGQDWHGNKIKHQGEVLYICGEGRRNITRRLRAVCQERGLGRDTKIRITNMPVMLAKEDQAKWLLNEIISMRAAPILIIVDTLSRNYGANENQTEDMNGFIDNVAMLSRELGATVLIIHHCGYDTTHARGAYTLFAGLDAVYKVEADKKNHQVKLTNEKMKDA